jgi:hypothetical protein
MQSAAPDVAKDQPSTLGRHPLTTFGEHKVSRDFLERGVGRNALSKFLFIADIEFGGVYLRKPGVTKNE